MEAYKSGLVRVDSVHSVYYACYGNIMGKPVMLFHGGPGYGVTKDMLEPFDFSKWNIIAVDQRGCGKSQPIGCLEQNRTDLLVDDMRIIADYLGIKRFTIKGESWGTTLALLFAEKYPEYVVSMILTGVFLGNNDGTLLGKYGGFDLFYPEYWQEYISLLPEEKRTNPYISYYDYIINGSDQEKYMYGRELIFLENVLSLPVPDDDWANKICNELDCYNIARVQAHYTVNDFFVSSEQIEHNIEKIEDIPVSIVQGRHDLIVPIKSAWKLSKLLPNCDFHISEFGGHSDFSDGTVDILREVINSHYLRFS